MVYINSLIIFLQVVLHFWSIGGSSLQVVSFLFLRNVCVRLGSDCLDTCLKGIYKAYVLICKIKGKYASVSKLKQVRFLGNCVTELYGIDLPISYQHAFSSIRQLAIVLRNALSEKPKVCFPIFLLMMLNQFFEKYHRFLKYHQFV